MKFRATIGDHSLVFTHSLAEHRFYQLRGTHVVIELDDKPTAEMRRFFEGAVVPYVYWQHPNAGWETFAEAREAIKAEFLPYYVRGMDGKLLRASRSTTTLSKAKFTAFLETVLRWMEENGYEVPEPDDFKRWRDSAPIAGEVYPPLQRLMDAAKRG